jgi:hypothetical protein
VRWLASAASSAASRPSPFISYTVSYTVRMTRQCGAWALTSRAVRAPPRTGPSADAGADPSGCRGPQGVEPGVVVLPKGGARGAGGAVSYAGLRAGSRDRHGLMAGRALHDPPTRGTRPRSASGGRAWRHGEGQSGPAYLDDLWGGSRRSGCLVEAGPENVTRCGSLPYLPARAADTR